MPHHLNYTIHIKGNKTEFREIKVIIRQVIQSVSSLTASEHIPKGIIPTVENTENIITTSASHNKITA